MQCNRRRPRVRPLVAALMLAVALAAALVVQTSPAVAGSAGGWRSSEVESRSLALPTRLPVARPGAASVAPAADAVTLDPGIPFTMLGLTCAVPQAEGAVLVRLRTSADGVSWSRWYEVPLELVSDGRGGQQACTEALWTGPGRLAQVRAAAAGGQAPVALSDVRLVALDTEPQDSPAQAALSALRRVAGALGALDGADVAAAAVTQPSIVLRAAWGADESLRDGSPTLAPVRMAFIHNTGGGNTYTEEQAPGIVRGVYEYHTQSLGWSDIGYNFLVDRFGTIYEGRFGGVREGPVGAQTYGFNTGSTGVSVIGDYMDAAPPAAARAALATLLAWKLELHGIDPQGTVTMTCGGTDKYAAGETVKLPAIAAHRDANYTDCPGDAFTAALPALRAAVAKLVGTPPPPSVAPAKWLVTLSLAPPQIAVNGRVTLAGTVKTAGGAPGAGSVSLQKRAVGGAWATWRTATLAADGSYAISVRMTVPQVSQVRARMAGDGAAALTGYSVARKVTVAEAAAELPPPATAARPKWAVALSVRPSQIAVNGRVALKGSVRTAAGEPGTGTVILQKRPAGGDQWSAWRTVTLRADGSYATSVRMTMAQVSQVRARMAGDAASATGYSALRTVTVRR